jgi:hypothetical protein
VTTVMLAPAAAGTGGVTSTVTKSRAGPELAVAASTVAPIARTQAAVSEGLAGEAVMVGG